MKLDHLQVYEERYPVTLSGNFSSSDPRLNQVWQVGINTLFANMSDGYADPWRERGQWWGDAFVDYYANLAAFGDTTLLRRGLYLMAEAFTDGRPVAMAPNGAGAHMLDYGMLWAQALSSYWDLTQDSDLIQQVYPALKAFLNYLEEYENGATGLLDIPSGHWSVTTLIDWDGFSSRQGESTAVNALYYATLLAGSHLASAMQDAKAATSWQTKAYAIKQQAYHFLYLPEQQRFLSSILDGEDIPPSPHAQAWSLANEFAPDGETGPVADSLVDLLSSDPADPNVEIYGMFWVLDGLGRAGRIQDALDLIKSDYGRLLDLGATTWWETFHANEDYWAALSHGWGSAPTWFLSRYLLGAERTGPESWKVTPAFRGVETASGSLPLQTGAVQISWANPGCGSLSLDIVAPQTSLGEVVIPYTSPSMTLALDGEVVWQGGSPVQEGPEQFPDGVHIPLTGGPSTFEIQGVQPDCPALQTGP